MRRVYRVNGNPREKEIIDVSDRPSCGSPAAAINKNKVKTTNAHILSDRKHPIL